MIVQARLIRMASLVVLSVMVFSLLLFAQKGDAGRLKTKVSPGRAGIFVDGKYLGPAANFGMAKTYSLPAGEHELLLAEPRYKDFTTKIKIEPGKTTVLSQSMEPLPTPQPPFGCLRVVQGSNGKFGAVYLNGKYMGHIHEFSNFAQGLLIKPGDYQLKIAPVDGGQEHSETITIKENQTTTVRAGGK